jgi:tetratricopeptide (TPR) repeat protein
MGPLLKVLGLTIWGLVALGLLAVFIFVGYESALKLRSPGVPVADTSSKHVQSNGSPGVVHSDSNTGTQSIPAPKNLDSASKVALEATRKRFGEAAEQRQFAKVLETGKHLYDAGLTSPDDLLIIAHAFSSIGDCDDALVWAERANDALRSVGSEPNEFSGRIRLQCKPDFSPGNPAPNADAGKITLADRFVKIGELYYGFGDYQRAIIAIQRGLDIGGVSHLDDAYVYLGQSELKLNNTEAACRAFKSLRGVPNLEPRVLKLWQLFADMHC